MHRRIFLAFLLLLRVKSEFLWLKSQNKAQIFEFLSIWSLLEMQGSLPKEQFVPLADERNKT